MARRGGNNTYFQYFQLLPVKKCCVSCELNGMPRIIFLQTLIAATFLTTALGTEKIIAPLLPAFPIPTVEPTPEYSPPKPDAVPVCQLINLNHTGIKLPQEPGDILVCQASPSPTLASINVGTTTTVVKTTNTTTTGVRTVTTTTTTTIEATTTSTNSTVPMAMSIDVKSCLPQGGNGTQYNWWQILTDSGGKPGRPRQLLKSNRTLNKPENFPPIDPCVRPFKSRNPNKYTYKYRVRYIREEEENYLVDDNNWPPSSSSYIREEIGYTRMLGVVNEFLDVRGDFIWKPPIGIGDVVDFYSVYYVLDDTGFWVNVIPLVCHDEKQCSLSLLASQLDSLRGEPFKFATF